MTANNFFRRALAAPFAVERFIERRSAFARWTYAALWYALIFTLSAIPSARSAATRDLVGGDDALNAVARFCAHAALFSALAALIYAALNRTFEFRPKPFVWAAALNALCGLSDEIHQFYVPGRHFRLQDVATDAASGLLFLWFLAALRRKVLSNRSETLSL